MAANWEYINLIYNRFLGLQFSVEVVSGEICRGKNGVDGLLDFLEWFTKYQALDKCLYQGKLALLSEAMRKISPEAFDLSLSRGQSLNPFMATLSSGAISSQPQSVPPLPPQQQSAFLPHQQSTLPPQQQSVPLPLFLEAEPDHVDALGLDDEGVLASMQTCSNKWLSPDGPQEQPLSTPRVDAEFVDLGEVHDHCDIDEEEVTLEGGCFSKEEHAGIDEIYQNILALAKGFGKKHCQSVQCVLTKLSMDFASREQWVVTSSWNAYVGLNLNLDSNVSQNDYIRLIAGPAYKKMIADAGGRDSDGWRRQHDDLVKRYDALRKE